MPPTPPGFYNEIVLRLVVSLLIGAAIGLEREYWSKAAGFRTMIMICLGSTLFTLISLRMEVGTGSQRIASNIVTGIGFLGGGVIFKDGLTISGITTATTIWITAALGMVVGIGEFYIAMVALVIVLVVLSIFQYVQNWIDKLHQTRVYKIISDKLDIKAVDKRIEDLKLRVRTTRLKKEVGYVVYVYEIHGKQDNFNLLTNFLLESNDIKSFEY